MEPVHWAILLKPIAVPIFMFTMVAPVAWVLFKLFPNGRLKVMLFKDRSGPTRRAGTRRHDPARDRCLHGPDRGGGWRVRLTRLIASLKRKFDRVGPSLRQRAQVAPIQLESARIASDEGPMSNMSLLLFAFGLILIAFVIALVLHRRPKHGFDDPTRMPYRWRRPLTEREQVLYWRLRKAMPQLVVMPQVALSRFLEVRAGHNQRSWLNRIDRMTIDFLVCLPDSTVVAAIELDDSSHQGREAKARDARKSIAIDSAGLSLIRYAQVPSEDELKKAIFGDEGYEAALLRVERASAPAP